MDKEKKSNLIQRTISGFFFALAFILMIDLSRETFVILWLVMGLMSLLEFYILVGGHSDKLGSRTRIISWFTLGTIYIVQAYILLIYGFNDIFQDGGDAQRMFILMIITLIWSNDIGAYIIGITLGKHKMAPSISPKKSWEGFCGGILFTIGASAVWKVLCWDKITIEMWDYEMEWGFFVALGLLAALAAVGGDLVESKFKRIISVKDSGKFLPGHGGVLDRMDSLLLTTPVIYIFIFIYFAL